MRLNWTLSVIESDVLIVKFLPDKVKKIYTVFSELALFPGKHLQLPA